MIHSLSIIHILKVMQIILYTYRLSFVWQYGVVRGRALAADLVPAFTGLFLTGIRRPESTHGVEHSSEIVWSIGFQCIVLPENSSSLSSAAGVAAAPPQHHVIAEKRSIASKYHANVCMYINQITRPQDLYILIINYCNIVMYSI